MNKNNNISIDYEKFEKDKNDIKEEKKRKLIIEATNIVLRYERLKMDNGCLPTLRKTTAKYFKKELLEIKKQLEELENEKR